MDSIDVKYKNGMHPRAHHVSEIVNNYMIVFGGINIENCEMTNEVYLFDFLTFKWMKIDVTGTKPPPLSGMAACLVISSEKLLNQFDLLKFNEMQSISRSYNKVKLINFS